ncbi:ESX-4 secretion system protein EccC4 [Madurella mycetomatis]|uniref:ESX-4 secretion system protein EccC4 n=1 Tax=Madurella mycetomatis TaxID=100816 RepID=A0A175VXH5_9PEZI|nr:ESX-4 secretion system protein EccC4 [Madurella mycetomatis]
MEAIRSMLACILCRRGEREGYTELIYDEKMALYSDEEPYAQVEAMTYDATTTSATRDARTIEEVAEEVSRLLWRAEWNDDALQSRISEAVGDRRWNRKMVEECLNNVIEYVEQGRARMGGAMCEALDKATDIADEEFAFPRRHPESLDGFIAIVSVGMLAEMQGAWVLELLGFGEVRGKEAVGKPGEVAMLTSDKIVLSPKPRRYSVAAWWSREYEAYIPQGSVASYLRRMDMIEPAPAN